MRCRYSPWDHASRLDLRIIHRDLPTGLLGYWHAPARTIVLDSGLTQVERRCTLAHELVHVERGDDGQCSSDWHENKLELQVHAAAARRLIGLPELGLALILHEHEVDQADELWVDVQTLQVRLAGLSPAECHEIATYARPVYRRRPA